MRIAACNTDRNSPSPLVQDQAMRKKPSRPHSRSLASVLTAGVLLLASSCAWASVATTQPPLKPITINLQNKAALRNGALYTLHMCTACHSLQGMRYSSLPAILGLSKNKFKTIIGTNDRHYHDIITSNMPPSVIYAFTKILPPDLTYIARRHSPAWLYTYLTSFYVDPTQPTGTNNVVFHNVAMPDVFAPLQGLQKPILIEGLRYGSPAKIAIGVRPLTRGSMTPAQFDRTARDIVTFLYAVAHSHQQERFRLGPWIIALFLTLSVLTYLLYKLYWRRVMTSEERWWKINKQ